MSLLFFALQIVVEDHGPSLLERGPWEEYFVDFLRDAPELTGDEPEDTETETPKIYEPIPSFKTLSERLSMFQQQYNDNVRGAPMNLVFFEVSLKVSHKKMCGSHFTPESDQNAVCISN